MSSPEPLMELEIPVERAHAGAADTTQLGTTQLERFFNSQTVVNASEWLYHHPEDEKFVPEQLPEPNPVTVAMSSMDAISTASPGSQPHRAMRNGWGIGGPAADALPQLIGMPHVP
jgi:hypothetical protein